MGLRARLNRLEGQANQTMFTIQDAAGVLKELLQEVEDGVEIQLVKAADGSLLDFLSGPAGSAFPVAVRLKLKE